MAEISYYQSCIRGKDTVEAFFCGQDAIGTMSRMAVVFSIFIFLCYGVYRLLRKRFYP